MSLSPCQAAEPSLRLLNPSFPRGTDRGQGTARDISHFEVSEHTWSLRSLHMYLCLFNPEHRWEQGCVVLAQTRPCHHWVWAGGIFSGLHCVCHSLWAVKRDFFSSWRSRRTGWCYNSTWGVYEVLSPSVWWELSHCCKSCPSSLSCCFPR